MDAASPNDILRICAGTYRADFSINKDLTLEGDGAATTVLDAAFAPMYTNGNITFVNVSIQGRHHAKYYNAINNGGTLTIRNSAVVNNHQGHDGGTILNGTGATLTIIDSVFRDNGGTYGGAIVNNGTVVITNSLFEDNSSLHGGAIANGGSLTISGSTFTANSAGYLDGSFGGPGDGGAIANVGGNVSITNSTFVGNMSTDLSEPFGDPGEGGAISSSGGTLTITNSTFVGNTAPDAGGAIASTEGATTTVRNSIIASPAEGCQGLIQNGGGNLTTDSSCPGTVTSTAALDLGALTDNRGPTQTVALGAASSAIDAAVAAQCPVVDQRNTPPPQGFGCDAGAFEAGAPTIATDTFSRTVSNGWGTATQGGTWAINTGAASSYSVNGSTGRLSL